MPYFEFQTSSDMAQHYLRDYLMREGKFAPSKDNNYKKPLAVDLVNLDNEFIWAEEMDLSREEFDAHYETNNRVLPQKHQSYRHYVLSPDPRDKVSLETFRECCKEYVARAFENRFQIAIVYHNDNANKVLHAHIIVNSPVFDQGGFENLKSKCNYISTYFKEDLFPGRFDFHLALREHVARDYNLRTFLLQDLTQENETRVKDLGFLNLRDFSNEDISKNEQVNLAYEKDCEYFDRNFYYNLDEGYQRPYKSVGKTRKDNTKNLPERMTIEDTQLKKQIGNSDRNECKRKIKIVAMHATNTEEFIEFANMIGLIVYQNNYGEFVYQLRQSTSMKGKKSAARSAKFKDCNLGADFLYTKLSQQFKHNKENENNFASYDSYNQTSNTSEDSEELFKNKYKINLQREDVYYGKREREIIKKHGWSRNEDIRQRVDRAMQESFTEIEFLNKCQEFGIEVEVTEKNEYKFHHPDPKVKLAVTGERLGKRYTKRNVSLTLDLQKHSLCSHTEYKIDFEKEGVRYTKEEKELIKKQGWSMNEDIRQRVDRAMDESFTEIEFLNKCESYGVIVDITEDNNYLFHHPDPNIDLVVSSKQIGDRYQKDKVLHAIGYNDVFITNKCTTYKTLRCKSILENKNVLFNAFKEFGFYDNNIVVVTNEEGSESKIDTDDLLCAINVNKKYNVTCIEDYVNVIKENKNNFTNEELKEIFFAENLFYKLGDDFDTQEHIEIEHQKFKKAMDDLDTNFKELRQEVVKDFKELVAQKKQEQQQMKKEKVREEKRDKDER